MAKYAIIENGIVTNVVRAASKLEDHWRFITNDADVQIGDTFDGSEFSRPEPVVPVPASVAPSQAKLALLYNGKLEGAETALNAIEDATEKAAALIYWNSALSFRRDHPLISQIGAALELTEQQIDQLFITASAL